MSWLKAIGDMGRFFGKSAGGSGSFAMFPRGVQRPSNFRTKWAPKVFNGVTTGIQFFRSGVRFSDSTGLLGEMDKKGKFRNFADKTGLYKSPDAGSDKPQAMGTPCLIEMVESLGVISNSSPPINYMSLCTFFPIHLGEVDAHQLSLLPRAFPRMFVAALKSVSVPVRALVQRPSFHSRNGARGSYLWL